MPSVAWNEWATRRRRELDDIETAYRAVRRVRPPRPRASQQTVHAYVVLLSSQFQGYCRDLHEEAAEFVVTQATSTAAWPLMSDAHDLLLENLVLHRQLDSRNPTPSAIGADFNRFGLELWGELQRRDPRTARRRILLGDLNDWRNAVAHQDFSPRGTVRGVLKFTQIQRYRRVCETLARSFDRLLGKHLTTVFGATPWV